MTMTKNQLKKLNSIFKENPEVKLVYVFGSQVTGRRGPLSDYDFAVYLDLRDKKKIFALKFILMDKISRALKTDKVDLVILDITKSPELKFNIIKEGELIYEQEPFRVLIEPKIMMEYFDFQEWRKIRQRDYQI